MSNGIDFVIGGKDQAKPAMSSVEQSLQRLEKKTDSLGKSTKLLTTITGGLAAAYASVKSAMALLAGLDKINAAYDESALAVQGLETALRLQGANVEAESARLQSFASDMQSLVGAEDDATLAMMKHASMMGVATEDLDDMAKAAIGVGEAMGTDAESGMEMMRRAQEGNFMAFQKMFPAMRSMTTDTEKLAFVTDLAAKGLLAKADASNTVAGMGERANNALGDLMESVGALLAPVRLLISAGLTTLYESLSTLLIPAVEYANEVLENIGPIMDYVKAKVIEGVNAIVGAFTFFEVILTNLDSVWEIVVAQSELWMLQLVGVIEHALTVAIPAYAAWFGENFVNLIRDGLMLAFTVVTNHVQKIIDAFKALWDFIASGGTTDVLGQLGEISGRSWLEGFESSLTDLPSIMGRTISDREKELGETIGRVGGELGDEFSRKFAERMIKAGGDIGGELSKDIDLKMNAAGDVKDGKSGGTQSINAMESRLLTRGPATDPGSILKRIEDILDKTHSTQKGIAKSCSTIVNYQMESVDELTKITTNTGDTVLAVAIP
jgi:hypothetical protein